MIIFFHMHRCAGASIVSAFSKAGHSIVSPARDGMPLASAGGTVPLKLWDMKSEQLSMWIKSQREANRNFFAARWNHFDARLYRELEDELKFTCVRDPYERFLSSYKEWHALTGDDVEDWYKEQELQRYNFSVCENMPNYYTRMLCGLGTDSQRPLTRMHYELASSALHSMRYVLFLESPDPFKELFIDGHIEEDVEKLNMSYDMDEFDVPLPSFEERFKEDNAYDYELLESVRNANKRMN